MKHTTGVREVTKNIAVVQASHGDFGNDHLQEGREGGEDAELVRVEPETGCGREVATLHNAGRDENLGMFLMDDLQTGRALQVAFAQIRHINR